MAATSAVGNGKQLVISRVPLTSMPTVRPVAVVGKDAAQALTIFMITYGGLAEVYRNGPRSRTKLSTCTLSISFAEGSAMLGNVSRRTRVAEVEFRGRSELFLRTNMNF